MASFQAKKGIKRLRRRDNKKLTFCFVPARREIKNSKKIKKYHYGVISCQNWLEKAEKERK